MRRMVGLTLAKIRADIAAKHRERQIGGARLIGVGHRRVRMLLDFERARPVVLDRVAKAMQRTDAGIAAPGKLPACAASPMPIIWS